MERVAQLKWKLSARVMDCNHCDVRLGTSTRSDAFPVDAWRFALQVHYKRLHYIHCSRCITVVGLQPSHYSSITNIALRFIKPYVSNRRIVQPPEDLR